MPIPHLFRLSVSACAVLLALTACGGQSTGSGKTKHDTIVINNGSEPESLDPAKTSGVPEANLERQLFEGLVIVGKDGKTIPAVAASWENKDFKVWTFKLREDAKWSNGEAVTAQDFVYAWQRLVDPKTASPYASYLADAHVVNAQAIMDGKAKPDTLGVKALDAHTLEVTLSEPVPYFADMLVHTSVLPVPHKTIEQFGDKWTQPGNLVSNGAYTLKTWTVNSKIGMDRNPNYWNNAATSINHIEFLPIESESTDVSRFKAGEIDLSYNQLPADTFAQLKKDYPTALKVSPLLCTYYYEYNTQKPPFDDVRVRRALSLALDRDVIANKVMGQGQTPAYGFTPTITANFKANHPDWESWSKEKRIAEAKKLLNEAGYSDAKPLSVELLYNTSENHKKVAVAAAALWEEALGFVHIKLNNQEWKTYLDSRRTGNFSFDRAGWCADYNEPSSFLNTLKSTNSNNYGKYHSPQFDALMAQTLRPGTDDAQRAVLYGQAEAQLNQDMPIIPMYHYVSPRLVRENIQGYSTTDPLDMYRVQDFSFK